MKIVVNKCFGGFGFSRAFQDFYPQVKIAWQGDVRSDPALIQALETFGLDKASGDFAHLAIVEIPDSATDWTITDYDGSETVIAVLNGKMYFY